MCVIVSKKNSCNADEKDFGENGQQDRDDYFVDSHKGTKIAVVDAEVQFGNEVNGNVDYSSEQATEESGNQNWPHVGP